MGLFDRRRPQPEWKQEDPRLRRAAVGALEDPSILAEVARTDGDDRVREEAVGVLHGLALEGTPEVALAALEALAERKHLVSVARSAAHETVSRAALARLDDPKSLGSVARHGRHVSICLEALERIAELAELGEVAQKSEHAEVALAALDRMVSRTQGDAAPAESMVEILAPVAERARCKAAARRARGILRGGSRAEPRSERPEADEAARPFRHVSDRKRQIELCQAMEVMGTREGSKRLAAHISEVREAWIELVPDVDEDLEERFNRALRAAREHLARNQEELLERDRREREAAEFSERHITPRVELCEMVESSPPEEASQRLEDARWEWERLTPLLTEEGQALQRRFEEACAAGGRRLQSWQEQQAAERAKAERETAQREREQRLAENQRRLQQLCTRLERQIESGRLTLTRAIRGLREAKTALEDPGPLSTRGERTAILKRLHAIQSALYPKVSELRESEEWKRWANTRIQEELCARAEALREVPSPLEAARRLTTLQDQWRKASTVSREKSLQLWLRFKAARDEVRSRLEAYRAEQAARKDALCAQAEALGTSTDWVKTAEALKALQAEWKKVGPSRPAQDRALWERFRRACNQFFTRRKEDLKGRRQEWARNREAKESLCAQAEALVESIEWPATAATIKKLQADWKAIGPVARKDSEPLWRRFRGACDRFFERYKRRDQIDRETRLGEREALCRELETLLPESAAPPPPPAAPEGLVEVLRSLRNRWQQGSAVAGQAGTALEKRFEGTLGRILAAFPEAMAGSEFDVEDNRRRMEDLCSRVEKLLPEEEILDESAASPASRLAALWVERMAANTIGGGVSDEARWRAATEEVKKAQAAWPRIGYLPSEVRHSLISRFQRACSRVLEEYERRRVTLEAKSSAPRKR